MRFGTVDLIKDPGAERIRIQFEAFRGKFKFRADHREADAREFHYLIQGPYYT